MVDARGYQPTTGTPEAARDDPATQLEKVIAEGLEEGERYAPTAETLAKMFIKAAPVLGQFVDERLAHHEYRRELDEEFWTSLSQRWGKPVRELRRKYGKRVAQLSVDLFVDPRTRQTKPEYLNDSGKAFADLTASLERDLNMAAEDAPAPPRPRSRAATGEYAGARSSAGELEKTVASVLGRR